jgi:hypothetical protein
VGGSLLVEFESLLAGKINRKHEISLRELMFSDA